jgi:hypothetical protein
MLAPLLAAACLCALQVSGAETKTIAPTPAGSKSDDQVLVELRAANAARLERDQYEKQHGEDETYKKLDEKFRLAVQKVSDAFPLLEPLPQSSTNRFARLTFNKRGAGLDGFRFKNSSEEPKTFAWAAAFPPSFDGWYIFPVEGSMTGFTSMWRDDGSFPAGPWNNSTNRFFSMEQSLGDTKILPGKEYFIWLSFTDGKPHDAYVAFGLFPAADPLHFKSEIQRALGLR